MAAFSAIDSEPPFEEDEPIDSKEANASEDAPGRGAEAAGVGLRFEDEAGALKDGAGE